MLIADRFRFVDMSGAPFRHRQALVTSFRLETHIDDDDMPKIVWRRLKSDGFRGSLRVCESRSNTPSLKRPICLAAPE